MRTLLICHQDSALDREVFPRWLSSFSDLAGVIVLIEPRARRVSRLRRELKRSGFFRFLDVVAFGLYYRLRLARKDRAWEAQAFRELKDSYPEAPSAVPVLVTPDPNTPDAERFVKAASPDVIVARCRVLLDKRIFSLAPTGTFVMHPGATPEYRNSHGCFWALANRDLERVAMTLLRIDEGVDTGPVYGYYRYDYDERRETHVVIQKRMVLENLDAVRDKLLSVHSGEASPLDTSGRKSRAWGQPWLTKYVRWKLAARKELSVATLLYHDVVQNGRVDESGFPGAGPGHYKLDTDDFTRHLEELARRTEQPPVTVAELGDAGPALPWLLTFDDGGASAIWIAERLAERGWPGHFFITADWIGRPGFVDASAISALEEMGHVVGSHSCSHPTRMAHCPWSELLDEWKRSTDVLAEILGHAVSVAAVPGGDYRPIVARAAAAAGIRTLFTSEPVLTARKVDGCLVLGRLTVHRGTSAEKAAALASGDSLFRARQIAFWNAKKAAKTIGGKNYLRLRRFLLPRL